MPISGVVRGNSIWSGDALFQAWPTKLFAGLAARAHPTSLDDFLGRRGCVHKVVLGMSLRYQASVR